MKKRLALLKQNFKLRHLVELILLTVCFFIGASVLYTNEIEPRKQDAYTVDPIEANGKPALLPLENGETRIQDFSYNNDQMIALGIMIYSDSDDNTGSLHLILTDTATGEILGESDTDVSAFTDMRKYREKDEKVAYVNVGMPTIINGMNGRALTLSVEARDFGGKNGIFLYGDSTGENLLIRGYCYLYNFWEFYFRLFATVLYIMLVLSFFALLLLEAPLQRVYLFAGFVLGVTYNFLLPPGATPGESTGGIEELKAVPDLKEIAYIHWNVGRSFQGVTVLYLRRFLLMLVWLLAGYLLIRFIPKGKAALFVLMISPAVFELLATFSPFVPWAKSLADGTIGNGLTINPFWTFFQCALILFGLIPVKSKKSFVTLLENRDPQIAYLSLINAMFFINNILSSTKEL